MEATSSASPSDPPTGWKHPFASLTKPGKALVGLVATGVIGGLITLLINAYGPTITDTISSGPPLDVVVQYDKPLTTAGYFALPGTLAGNAIPQQDLAAQHPEAVAVGRFTVKLILQGRRSQPALITDLRARVLSRSKPIAGMLISTSGSENTNTNGCVYLADLAPTFLTPDPTASGCLPGAKPYFAVHNLTLNRGEQAVIDVNAMVSQQNPTPPQALGSYEWEFVLRVVQNGKSTDMTIRDGTQPFRLTALSPDYRAAYSGVGVMNPDSVQGLRQAFLGNPPR
ncbi:hypothetical protein ABIA39_004165 [Nocardia sp. GAS34]|uniref:hypothetical protein n=1 Tax=unclassified Nocardia TaxID=2637762 RepID=UPI003D227303